MKLPHFSILYRSTLGLATCNLMIVYFLIKLHNIHNEPKQKKSRSNLVVFPSFFFEIEIIGLNLQKEESNNSLFPILFQPFTSSYFWNFFVFS